MAEFGMYRDNERMTSIITRLMEADLQNYGRQVVDHCVRRWADTLYAELLPAIREGVIKAIDTASIAKIIEGEIQMALSDALSNEKKGDV